MTAFLVGTSTQSVLYDRTSGKYRDRVTGRYVSRSTILRLVDAEAARLEVRLKAHARNLTNNRIDLPEFQSRMADDLKLSHLRLGILGSGGRSLATTQTYGAVGRGLRSQYVFLDGFSRDIAAGNLTKSQIINRAGLYGVSTRAAFHSSEKIARGREGFKLARRVLDSASQHCNDCLSYATGDRYLPIEQIVPIAAKCECQARCRCRIEWKKN